MMNNEEKNAFENKNASIYSSNPPEDLLGFVNETPINKPEVKKQEQIEVEREDDIGIDDLMRQIANTNVGMERKVEDSQKIESVPNIRENNDLGIGIDDLMRQISNLNDESEKSRKEQKKEDNVHMSDTDLSKATIGLTPIEKKENVEKIDMDVLMKKTASPKVEKEIKTRKENKMFLGVAIGSGVTFIVVLLIALLGKGSMFNFSGGGVYYQNKVVENLGEYQTAVVTDNIYEGVTVNDDNDAKNLIVMDSNNQKAKCNNAKTKQVETSIEKNYGITAVNLCEMDYEFAKEIENTLKTVYKEFPNIKGHLTNLTLINTPEFTNYIASFVSAKLFAKSNTRNTYPNVYKMSIYLNASYFLNIDYFDASISDSVVYGYFPPNASRYSIVAHEFGHYLSFLAQMRTTSDLDDLLLLTKKNYKAYSNLISDSNNGVFSQRMINEAFENYKKKNPSGFSDVTSFRSSISSYAVVTNSNGEYIYDETIAEAFHDYYLNGKNAKDASKEIMNVLKKYLK